MKLYIAGIEDSHADIDVQAFTDREMAVAYVRDWAQSHAHMPEDYEELHLPQYYEFYASYSPESDCVWVLVRELDDPAKLPGGAL